MTKPKTGTRIRWKSNGREGTVTRVYDHDEHTYFDVQWDDGPKQVGWRFGTPTAEDYEFFESKV